MIPDNGQQAILVGGSWILQAASRYIEEKGFAPSAERKLIQAHRGLSVARLVLESGDLEAAREQCHAALTLGYFDLAAALDRLIHAVPCRDELRTDLEVGESVVRL